MILRICSRLSVVAALFGLSLIFAVGARAQNTADILGTVSDASGAVVPDATVTLTNTATNISQTATASGNGDYTFTLLQPGTYSVKVEAKGFKTFSAPGITVSAGDRARVNAPMQVGEQSTTVEVQASTTPALQTDTSNLGTLVTSQIVEDVPLNGRNITKLIQLSAGVNEGSPGSIVAGNRPDDRRQTAAFSVNGQSDSINNNLIDGMDNNERIIGGNGVRPSVDAIQEINVSTNLYDASQGRTGGGVVDVITKSGSNSFHGSAYEFFRNRVLNTNPGYSFPSGFDSSGVEQFTTVLPKPAFRQNQYGASIGGPIRKNKTFFFTDYEKFQKALGTPFSISVPTLCERGLTLAKTQGFKGTSTPCPNGNPTTPGDFTDLSTISSFGGGATVGAANSGPDLSNLTSATTGNPYFGLNKIGLEYFSMFPLPNGPGTRNNFSSTPMNTQESTTIDGRIDQHISDKDTFYGRYSINDVNTGIPNGCPPVSIDPATGMVAASGGVLVKPGCAGTFPGKSEERQQSIALSFVHVFSPNLLLNLKAGYSRSSIRSLGVNDSTDVSNALGFPCTTAPVGIFKAGTCVNMAGQKTATGLEDVTFNVASPATDSTTTPSYQGFGDPSFVPLLQFDNNFLYSGSLTWNKGSQSIKIGLGVIRRRATIGQSNNPNGGGAAFTGIYTGVPVADLLEGWAASNSRNYTLYQPGFRTWEPSVYIQDDWRTTKWLTLNLGLRYDIFTPFTEVHGRSTNYDQSRGLIVGASVPGAQQSNNTAGILTDYHNLAPRFGFSASLPHSLVIRGGFGLSFFPINYQSPYNLKNAPGNYQYTCQVQHADGSVLPCTGTPFDNGQVAHFGVTSGGASTINKPGGWLFPAGLPAPFFDINQVFAPSAALCSYGGSLANYSPTPTSGTCPSSTDPYQGFGLGNIQNFGIGSEYLEQMNVQLQKAFGANVVTVGGVVEMGRHAPKGLGLNVISNSTQVVSGSNNPPLANAFPWLAKTTVTQQQTTASDAYSGLQATFVRRFSKGLTTQVNYTWAHARSFSGGNCTPTVSPAFGTTPSHINPCFYDNVSNPGSPFQVNWYNQGFASSNTGNDVADRVAWSMNYQLPFGKSLTGIEGAIIKGWATNLGGSWQTGLSFTPTQNASGLAGTGAAGNPDQVCSGRLAHPTLTQWFNPACFRSQTPNTFGNELGGQIFGPSQKSMSFSLNKEFPVKENIRLQFRTEVFNLFNTPNFAVPANANLQIQYGDTTIAKALRCDPNVTRCTGVTNPAGNGLTGSITGLNTNASSRQIQFALKVLF